MKVVSIVGARPQFVKLAPVAAALTAAGHEHVIVHTGQHYDDRLSDVFFADLAIPRPDVHLGVGSGSHGVQTGAMLSALDGVLDAQRPDWVLVYGDTNSTIAGALSAVKMHLPVAHLEAGLRSFNRAMPEEHNRVLTDHAADLLLAPTQVAVDHLASEGLAKQTVLVGDVMTDVCFRVRDAVLADPPPAAGGDHRRLPGLDDPPGGEHRRPASGWPPSWLRSPGSSCRCCCSPTRGWSPRPSPPASTCTGRARGAASSSPARCPTRTWSPRCWGRAGSSPTAAACRRRPSSWSGCAPPSAPRRSGSRPSRAAGTSSPGPPTLMARLPEFVARPVPDGPRAAPYGDGHAAPLVARTLAEWA